MSGIEESEILVGQLLSVNVGGPRDVSWRGNMVRTAIWKSPVAGPRMVRQINIDGDEQADRNAHGGEHRAVFVYQIESYRYWARELHRDDFSHGQFGENFTVEGLSDDDVCIGDRYRIGEAIFEVTQPRVTCFRVGIRLDDPRMPSLLVARHRPGFYFRVLQEGEVQAGDEIVRLQVGPERLSVADADALLYLPNKSRRDLQRALRIPALSEGWRGSFQELLEHDGKAKAAEPPAWPGFVPLTVVEIRRESDAIVSFTLAPAAGAPPAAAVRAGQYLTFRLQPDGPDAAPVVRSYSLSAVPTQEGFRISVKLEPRGLGSGFLHGRVRVGDTIEAAAPRGEFTLREGGRPIALISAGVGATPVLAMLQALAAAGDEREVWWLHGARDRANHAFGREVDELLRQLPHAHRLVTYSRPAPGESPGAEFDAVGRLSIETITAAGVPADADYYICGPAQFMSALSAGLVAHGVAPERVAMETFGAVAAGPRAPGLDKQPPPHVPAGAPGTGPAVTFSRSGLTVPWDRSYGSLLELAEACDVPVSFGCRNGVCHYCESGLLAGDVDYVTEPLEAPDAEHVLMCCTTPTTEVTLDL